MLAPELTTRAAMKVRVDTVAIDDAADLELRLCRQASDAGAPTVGLAEPQQLD